ncbi:15961_t:CDS:2 [Funneliformis mosseae]|uniref:15961_t:CDS:1 n=1 Tax=Funneliformis mosseae TaxID=27381 RepID=A0A9N8UX67_FUNMO|nr:15961_t:CDS:2 [Funneliformis mosseae]
MDKRMLYTSEDSYPQSREPNRSCDDNSPTYLAISPNGILAATFNSVTYEIKIYGVVNKEVPTNLWFTENEMKELEKHSKDVSFSLAISDSADKDDVVYVAVSRFKNKPIENQKTNTDEEQEADSRKDNPRTIKDEEKEIGYRKDNPRTIKVEEKEIGYRKDIPGREKMIDQTFVFSTKLSARIKTAADNRGGIVRFLNNNLPKEAGQLNGFTNLIVMNASEITKVFINNINHKKFSDRSIFKNSLVSEEYEFPTIIQDKLYHNSCTRFLNTIVERNYLFVEDYKNHILEMYNLHSMNLDLTFQNRDQVTLSKQFHENAIFSISKHRHLLAYCNGTKSITIYLMENGLEVTTKEFTDANKILLISFIDDDERLLVVTDNITEEATEQTIEEGTENTIEEGTVEVSEEGTVEASEEGTEDTIEVVTGTFTPTINIWDLFTFSNDVRVFDDDSNIFSSLQKSNSHSIALSNGSILASLQDGDICKFSYDKIKLKPPNISPINQVQEDHQEMDAKKKPYPIIKEPWVSNKKDKHIPSYLDEYKTIQLIIGETTVQVWKKRKGHDATNDRVLKYIWVNLGKQNIKVDSLKIGNCEFYLDLSWDVPSNDNTSVPSDDNNTIPNLPNDSKVKKKEHIHWPNKAHVLKDACVAMEYLYKRRYDSAGSNNLNKYEELFVGTEKLINKCIKKNPSLWSLTEVRYGIMANIIRSKNIPLLHRILFDYKEADGNKQDETRLAIGQSLGENRRDKSIVAMLLEYYSNNAEKDIGWMFTVTKSLPSLKKYHFEPYLKELFYKPCFGSKEEFVDSKFVSQRKLKEGYKSEICSLNVRPRLLLKQNKSSWWNKLKSLKIFEWSSKDTGKKIPRVTAVRVVPLPDFTVYPTNATDRTHNNWMIPFKLIKLIIFPRIYLIHDKNHFSPFLKLMSKNENEQLYDNPAMEACIDFKWGAARNCFLRHFTLFIAFSLTFALGSGIIKDVKSKILTGLFFYFGYYLLMTEFIQLKHQGFKRYLSIYNILDVVSIFLALITMIIYLTLIAVEVNIVLQAFAVLLLWFELHIILEHPNLIDLKPNGNKFVINSTNPDFDGLTIEQVFDVDDPMDNYYRKLTYSVMGAYFWILGRWDQIEVWDFWPIYVISIGASILIVTIMQNLLIAFMTGVYENARHNVKLAVLGYRADLVADYETLEKPLDDSDDSDDDDQDEQSLNVASKDKNDQKFKLAVDDHEDKSIITNDEQFVKLQDEMKMLKNEAARTDCSRP